LDFNEARDDGGGSGMDRMQITCILLQTAPHLWGASLILRPTSRRMMQYNYGIEHFCATEYAEYKALHYGRHYMAS